MEGMEARAQIVEGLGPRAWKCGDLAGRGAPLKPVSWGASEGGRVDPDRL